MRVLSNKGCNPRGRSNLAQQQAALVHFANTWEENCEEHRAGDSDANELAVSAEHHGAAMLRAGEFATIQTRGIGGKDHLCGNEVTFYPPLTQTAHSMPAVALTDSYSGPGLGVSWDLHGKRSAFVGTFADSSRQQIAKD
jgi:hypothetical protein